jgi:hypothetical protein
LKEEKEEKLEWRKEEIKKEYEVFFSYVQIH